MKMLKDLNDPALEEEIERELNMMRRLDHENIVRIYGAFSVADTGNTGKILFFQISDFFCVQVKFESFEHVYVKIRNE